MAGYDHVNVDGTLIETDQCRTPGPTPGVDLWWSGKHDNHVGSIQVITAPDGWPLWTSQVRPGREHDTTALREHTEMLPLLVLWTEGRLRVLGDLGYEGELAANVWHGQRCGPPSTRPRPSGRSTGYQLAVQWYQPPPRGRNLGHSNEPVFNSAVGPAGR